MLTDQAVLDFREAALQSLSKLSTPHAQSRAKQESTILAIAVSRAINGSFDRPQFWERGDVAARSTFNKWKKHDPSFNQVLNEVTQLAQTWRSSYAAGALQEALELIQVNAPTAALTMIDLMVNGEETTQRQAAADILNRASMLTAQKQSAKVTSDISVQSTAVSGDELADLVPKMDKELAAWRKDRTNE